MLNHEFPPVGGGASPVTLELCRALVRQEHHVDVVTMHFKGTPRQETIEGVRIYRTPALRKRPDICHTHELATYVPGALAKTLRLIRQNHYDIIHCHFMVPGSLLAYLMSKFSGVPYLVTCHGTDVPRHNPDRFKWVHRAIGPAWRYLAGHASLVTSPSEYLKDSILTACATAKVKVIPNGINLDRFSPDEKTRDILMCSRILAFKGFQHVIQAVKDEDLPGCIHIIGEGPYLPELKRLAVDCKTRIQFWGWLDQKDAQFSELFNRCSIFVFPSEAENFPTVLLEAMAAKMAIITSTAGGCSEVVGNAARFVCPGDIEGIRNQLIELSQSESVRSQLAEAAYARVKLFSWDGIASQFVETYQTLIS